MSEPTSTDQPKPAEAAADTNSGSTGLQDRVVMASRSADGTPMQSPDFEFIGDKDAVIEAAKHQHVSVALAGLQTSSDTSVNPTVEEQEAVIAPAEAAAEAEVNERYKGDENA